MRHTYIMDDVSECLMFSVNGIRLSNGKNRICLTKMGGFFSFYSNIWMCDFTCKIKSMCAEQKCLEEEKHAKEACIYIHT